MYIKPINLTDSPIDNETLKADKTTCTKYGPCGVGQKALYLSSFYVDRCFYAPYESISRVYKRVAMSKGGFTGKGMFASIPYLMVEFKDGKTKKCTFKDERDVDALLQAVGQLEPSIKLLSAAGEIQYAQHQEALRKRNAMDPTPEEDRLIRKLQRGIDYLEKRPDLSNDLSYAAKRKRNFDHTRPGYRWAAMAITLLGVCAVIYGIWSFTVSREFAIYFTVFGFAAIFFFAGLSVLPTAKNNRSSIYHKYDNSVDRMEKYLRDYGNFPVPAEYAHPIVLLRMQRAIGNHRAASIDEALHIIQDDLNQLNSSVAVEQEEYDEVVAVKPLFTVLQN